MPIGPTMRPWALRTAVAAPLCLAACAAGAAGHPAVRIPSARPAVVRPAPRASHAVRTAQGGATTAPTTLTTPSTQPTSTTQQAPTAQPVGPSDPHLVAAFPTVGTFFYHPHSHHHHCTATVLASTTGDTVITAAHCFHGSAAGMLFVPGYVDGSAPRRVWRVTGAYVPPQWQRDDDPAADYAVATVAPQVVDGRRVTLADLAGSSGLGTAPPPGTPITLVAYLRSQQEPISCRNTVYDTNGWPAIQCQGFAAGSSGSPWLSTYPSGRTVVRGVIGGPEDGGCRADTSLTASFTSGVAALLRRAELGGVPDLVRGARHPHC